MKKTFVSNGPLETEELASALKENLQNGDIILLKGEIGAGKSLFARSLIQSTMDQVEEVPSPTFTIVQTYETKLGSIWHADLYRLTDQSEIFELGLIDAFVSEIVIVEWPERLGHLEPQDALTVEIIILENDKREVIFSSNSSMWKARLEKTLQQ
ncbi:MAG: tRNA (adenosine(37)-N6)-threonylcarbamoyltransferase complex ATPase subunit type 1 TsaE [Rhodobacteraceae bacterium]|nr:tRNA (adenosine(37)-N6)-threonylcarbamoyltransferase complex ATPase subunit type 1 TsaE [Paracoccaceae bacterium]